MNEKDALIALNGVEGLSNRQILRLLELFGSAQAVWKLNGDQLRDARVLSEKAILALISFPQEKFLEKEYNLTSNNIIIITNNDTDYPEQLRQITDAPVVLYVYGSRWLQRQPAVAIVGARKASVYGRLTAGKLAAGLAERGVTVVSGLARGIDTAAHEGSLKASGCTVAVLGCGLGVSYPRENEALRHQIAEQGAVISEFPMQTSPRPYHFPRRNRIVSGLSRGVIVVEAAAKSGALITADFALEQGRDVFAVPAMIDHPNAVGGHTLIRQGAELVTSADDVLDALGLEKRALAQQPRHRTIGTVANELSSAERIILEHLSDNPVHIDELTSAAGLELPTATRLLLAMEMKKLITQLPGKRFKR